MKYKVKSMYKGEIKPYTLKGLSRKGVKYLIEKELSYKKKPIKIEIIPL